MKTGNAGTGLIASASRSTTQIFFFGCAIMCVLGALVMSVVAAPLPPALRGVLVLGWLCFALLLASFALRGPPARPERVIVAMAGIATVLIFAVAYACGQGLRTITLGHLALIVCLTAMLAGVSNAAWLCVLDLAGVGCFATLQASGIIVPAAALAGVPTSDDLLAHGMLLLGGLAAGALASFAIVRAKGAIEARERLYADLLSLAADRFWQVDAQLRIVRVQDTKREGEGTPAVSSPAVAWPPGRVYSPGDWHGSTEAGEALRDAHLEAMRAQRPFDDLMMIDRDALGRELRLSVSGRPRHSTDGQFIGYWCVGRDVTLREEQQRALARARDEAQAANQAKSAFLANVSHEIRTPLSGLIGLTDLARRSGIDEGVRRDYLDRIDECAKALTAIIGDVLDISKIEAGKLQIEASTFDLHEMLASLERVYGLLVRSHGLAFATERAAELPRWVRGDAVRVRQILTNFLGNALKFTQTGGIRLVARRLPDGLVRCEVHDTGVGIAPSAQPELFEPFRQLDDSRARRHGGTGLGLSICRKLAELMDGRVGVHSVVGEGSCFWVELPLTPAYAPVPDSNPGSAAVSATADGGSALIGRRILVVDDNRVNQIIVRAMLEGWGASVGQAEDGAQALRALAASADGADPFDLVLMDIQMPGRNGYEVAAEVRRRWDACRLPIIALTAAALSSERQSALDAGMDDVVTKPIDETALYDAIARGLARRSAPDGAVRQSG
ncbi:MAG: ATP-binding protein [Lautropia sp.]